MTATGWRSCRLGSDAIGGGFARADFFLQNGDIVLIFGEKLKENNLFMLYSMDKQATREV